jgi:hypothetical protein
MILHDLQVSKSIRKLYLIYVFQPNIVKNKHHPKYARWFEFAQKTRNVENKATDFEPYIHNSIFSDRISSCNEISYQKPLTKSSRLQNKISKIYISIKFMFK